MCNILPKDLRTKTAKVVKEILAGTSIKLPTSMKHAHKLAMDLKEIMKNEYLRWSMPYAAADIKAIAKDMATAFASIAEVVREDAANLTETEDKDKDRAQTDAEFYTMVGDVLTQLQADDTATAKLVEVLNRAKMADLREPAGMRMGEAGEAPSNDEMCVSFVSQIMQDLYRDKDEDKDKGKFRPMILGTPMIWRAEDQTVTRGNYCPISDQWYWTKVAKCSCPMTKDSCPMVPPIRLGGGGRPDYGGGWNNTGNHGNWTGNGGNRTGGNNRNSGYTTSAANSGRGRGSGGFPLTDDFGSGDFEGSGSGSGSGRRGERPERGNGSESGNGGNRGSGNGNRNDNGNDSGNRRRRNN